jgi:hypothetical protein
MSGYGGEALADRVPSLERQLQQLLNSSDAASKLHLTNVLRAMADHTFVDPNLPSTSKQGGADAAFDKLLLRIETSLKREKDVKDALKLISELIRAVPWNSIAHAAEDWIRAALTNFSRQTYECVRVLDSLTGSEARLRPEFWRNVAGPAAGKYALLLVDAVTQDSFAEQPNAAYVLDALARQVRSQPATFRTHAARLSNICMSMLFKQRKHVAQAVRLLAALPATGKGRDGEVSLWSATVAALIAEAELAWRACSSAYFEFEAQGQVIDSLFDTQSDVADGDDDVDRVHTSHERLAFVFGRAPTPGVLPLFLAEATTYRVPLPAGRLQRLLYSVLSLFPSSMSQLALVPEATLHATQAALMSNAHLCAFSLLATVPTETFDIGGHAKIVRLLLAHGNRGSPSIRCAAMQTLSLLQMPIDPHDELLIRCVRTCLWQLAKLVNRPIEAHTDATTATTVNGGGGGSTRAKKRRRVFESDQVVYRPLDGFADLDEDEVKCCEAAVRWIASTLFAPLLTFLTPDMHDLAETSALMLSGLLEISLKQPDHLTYCLTDALALMVSHSRGSLLALLAARTPMLCAQASISTHEGVREAARSLRRSLSDSFMPKLPPKLALRLHMDADVIRFDGAPKEQTEDDEGGKVLDDPKVDELRGTSEVEAMQHVLNLPSFGGRTSSSSNDSALQRHLTDAAITETRENVGASLSTHLAMPVSTDPVKPVRRPSTPNIGSPGTLTPSAKRRISHSPERLHAVGHLISPTTSSGPTLLSASGQDGTLGAGNRSPTSVPSSIKASEQNFTMVDLPKDDVDDVDDDSDGSLPQLDVRSSDEESEGE